jgi:hypothetical protein
LYVWFDRYAGTNVLAKPAGSIFRAVDGGRRLLQNTYVFIKLQGQKSNFPENSNIKT